jgi:hypothetical protein
MAGQPDPLRPETWMIPDQLAMADSDPLRKPVLRAFLSPPFFNVEFLKVDLRIFGGLALQPARFWLLKWIRGRRLWVTLGRMFYFFNF